MQAGRGFKPARKKSPGKRKLLIGLAAGLLLGAALRFALQGWLLFPYRVQGSSMLPSLAQGELVLALALFPKEELKRGSIALLAHPDIPGHLLLRRIVGLPGERILIHRRRIFIDRQELEADWEQKIQKANHYRLPPVDQEATRRDFFPEIELNEEQIFVLGDDRRRALDSRILGPFQLRDIVGLVSPEEPWAGLFSAWPLFWKAIIERL